MSAYDESDPDILHDKTGQKRGRPPGAKNKKPAEGRKITQARADRKRPKRKNYWK